MLSIVLVTRGFAGVVGGTERVITTLANGLAAAGHRVTLLHWSDREAPPPFPLEPDVAVMNLFRGYRGMQLIWPLTRALPHWRLRHALQFEMDVWLFQRDLAKWFAKQVPDLVISFKSEAHVPVLRTLRHRGIPVITSNHLDPKAEYGGVRWEQSPLALERKLAALAFTTVNHVLLPDYVDFFPTPIRAKTVVIPNAVTPGVQRMVGRVARRPLIVGIGRLGREKNFRALIEAWGLIAKDHPDWSVDIHAEGAERPMLEQLIDALQLTGRCRLPGETTDVPGVLASASLFCLPSLFEGFPLAVLEALACGVPVVGYGDCPGLNSLVRHEENGLLVDRSEGSAGLAAALDRLIRDEALRHRLSAAAPASVAEYSEEAFLARWLELITRVANAREVQ